MGIEKTTASDRQIIDLLFERKENGLELLLKTYGAKFTALASNYLKSREDAEECVNDSLVRIWNHIPPDRPQFLAAYCAKIVRNEALRKLESKNAKKRKALVVSLEEDAGTVPDTGDAYEAKELGLAVDQFLRTQEAENRWLFVQRYFFGASIETLAERSGCSSTAVKLRLHRIRKKMRTYLTEKGWKDVL